MEKGWVWPDMVSIDGKTLKVAVVTDVDEMIIYFNLTDLRGNLVFECDYVTHELTTELIREVYYEMGTY